MFTYYRIISAGFKAVTDGLINISSSTAYGSSPGFYSYIQNNPYETTLANLQMSSPNNYKISYNVLTIDRTTGETTFTNYNIFGDNVSNTNANAMITQLNGLTSSVIVVISTYDEPKNNGTHLLSQSFVNAMKRCGASAHFGSAGGTYSPGSYSGFINYRGGICFGRNSRYKCWKRTRTIYWKKYFRW